jgi:hypothetical protein
LATVVDFPKKYNVMAAVVLASALPLPALAGPPFFTDDPEPVEYQHWEIDTASQSTHVSGNTSGSAPSFTINYGALPNLELHIAPQLAFSHESGNSLYYGYGDTELGVKYRFLDPEENDWWPQASFCPLIEIPTGNAKQGLSTTGKSREFLPLFLQKSFGQWTTYGGGGYWNNEGVGNTNYWYFGWVLQRNITDELMLGGEIYHQTSHTIAGDPADGGSTGFNIGGSYDFSEHYHLLFSAGQAVQNTDATNNFSYYLGVQWTF